MAESKKDAKKQIPLRLSVKLYAAIAAWAEDDFRSVNGQIRASADRMRPPTEEEWEIRLRRD